MPQILVIDDHPLVLAGLVQALGSVTRANVVTCSCWVDAWRAIKATNFDLLLVDLNLPNSAAAQTCREIARLAAMDPSLPILILSASETDEEHTLALASGARVFLHKSSPPQHIVTQVLEQLEKSDSFRRSSAEAPDEQAATSPGALLTARQQDVLLGIAHGESNKEIAKRLGTAESTIKVHVAAIFKALGVSNRTQAALSVRVPDQLERPSG